MLEDKLKSVTDSSVLLSFPLDYFDNYKITLRKEKKTCTIIFLIYSNALHS